MGYYHSKFYYFGNLKHHQCNECTYKDEEMYVEKNSKDSEYPSYIFALKDELQILNESDFEKFTYSVQSCSKVQKRDEHDLKSYILFKPWRYCSMSPAMLGKIFETETPQKMIMGLKNNVAKLTENHDARYTIEHSYAPAIEMKNLPFLAHILPDSVEPTDMIFIDSDMLSPANNWKRVYNTRVSLMYKIHLDDSVELCNTDEDIIVNLIHSQAESNTTWLNQLIGETQCKNLFDTWNPN